MKALICEMCGGADFVKKDGVFVCQFCGVKYSAEEAKKLMIEGTVDVKGTVKVDNSEFVERYLHNARRALDKEDWEEVEKYYNMVEQNTDNNIEAVFFSSYGRAMLAMTDPDYLKRQQKFEVMNRSISVISDYYETTDENREEVLRRISRYIKKMYEVQYVYQPQSKNSGRTIAATGVYGSEKWCIALLNSTKAAFFNELRQIAEKHDDSFLQELLNENTVKEKIQKGTAESRIRLCGILGFLPSTFFAGIFSLCFLNQAKKENGGVLSKRAKRWLMLGVGGFFFWIIGFVLTFALIFSA